MGDPDAPRVVAAAKQVQTVIGDLQDARLVIDRLSEATAGPGPAPEVLVAAVARATGTVEQCHRRIGPALAELWDAVPGLSPAPGGRG